MLVVLVTSATRVFGDWDEKAEKNKVLHKPFKNINTFFFNCDLVETVS